MRAGVPMLPVVSGLAETRRQIFIYSLMLVPVSLSPWLFGYTRLVYAAAAIVLSVVFATLAFKLKTSPSERAAKSLFAYSVVYLFLIFAILLVDQKFVS